MIKRLVLVTTAVLSALAALTAVASATWNYGYEPRLPKSLRG